MSKQPQPVVSETLRRVEQSAKALGLGLSGVYLLVFFVLCLWLVITTLAAHQIQGRVRTISIAGQTVSVWVVRRAADVLNQQQQSINAIQNEIDKLNVKIVPQRASAFEAFNALYSYLEEEHRDYNAAIEFLKSNGYSGPEKLEVPALQEALHNLIKALSGDPANDKKLLRAGELTKSLKKSNQNLTKLRNNHQLANSRVSRLEARIQKKIDKLKIISSVAKTDELMKKIFPATDKPEESIKLQNLAGEVNSLRGFAFSSFFEFVTLQPEVLTLIVVLVMGVLGGLIHLTQGYLSGTHPEPFSYFLFRPMLGAVTALAIYILAKAGVLVVAETGSSNTQGAVLSPFFISFLAIISGLLAENAIANIRKAGENFLRPVDPTGTSRWAIGVKEAMKKAGNKKTADLLPFLDHPKGEIEDWIEGRKGAPENVQNVVSAWLGKPARELFTDIEPAKK